MEKRVKIKKKQIDYTLLITVMLLVFIGISMVFSASWPEAIKEFGNSYHFVKKQITFAIIGLGGMIFAINFRYTHWKKMALPIFILSILSVGLLFTPMGLTILGARRWVKLGPITFMPGDIVKVGAVIYFSSVLADMGRDVESLKKGGLKAIGILGFSVALILIQNDLGTAITLAATLTIMIVVAGFKLRYLLPLVGVALAGMAYLFLDAMKNPDSNHAFRVRRITSFLDPFADPRGSGWQAVQSLYALGAGGIFGIGLGKSKQKFMYIPESYNDFIFSIIGEELGFVGVSLIIILYMLIVVRGVKIALNSKDPFGFFLAIGITALISMQSLIHIAVVTSSIPTTGITLPFISYGGTSLVIYMGLIGILLNISKYGK